MKERTHDVIENKGAQKVKALQPSVGKCTPHWLAIPLSIYPPQVDGGYEILLYTRMHYFKRNGRAGLEID